MPSIRHPRTVDSRLSTLAASNKSKSASFILLMLVGCLTACQPSNEAKIRAALKEHERKLRACIDSLKGQTRIPILGGGFLRVDRFAFSVPGIRLQDGECGTDGFETHFYWTGQEILPNDERFTGIKLTEVPKHWRLMGVATRLGNLRRCQENPEKCKADPSALRAPKDWPPELVVRMDNYPLDVWLPRKPGHPAVRRMGFVLRDWPKADGSPRYIDCDIGRPVASVNRDEWKSMDFGERTLPCQVDLSSFNFKRGAGRISTGTESLRDITRALQALQTYLSDQIEDQ